MIRQGLSPIFTIPKIMYNVKEAYYTLQGEGAQAGRAAVFLRFAGCNLWNGREDGRQKAVCQFCDTQFVGTDGENGGKFKSHHELAEMVRGLWDAAVEDEPAWRHLRTGPYVVCTGGEPLLQLDTSLVNALQTQGMEVGVETNGTIKAPVGLDWICVSPKADAKIIQTSGNELKLVYPQPGVNPEDFLGMDFTHFFLSPRDVSFEPQGYGNSILGETPTSEVVKYCLKHPRWRLSLQTHKLLGIK